jgi:raffinose/stachyose/melibiose transport system substrate-binding protein
MLPPLHCLVKQLHILRIMRLSIDNEGYIKGGSYMLRKKMLGITALLLAMVMVFVGCSQTSDKNEDAQQTTAAGETTTTESETKEIDSAGETVNLKLFIPQPRFREQYESYLAEFIEYYKAEKGITVTYEMEMPGADNAAEILRTRLTTGDDLDVITVHAINEIPQYYQAGYLEDLSNEPWVSDLYEGAKQAVTIDGKVVALPLESLSWGILYNKGLFDELGLKPALTLSELQANVDAIEAAGKTGFLSAYNEAWIPQLFLPLTTGAYLNTTDTTFLNDMYENKSSYSSLSKMFDVIDLVHGHTNDNGLEIGGSDGCVEFATGNYGMWVQGPWFSSTILDAAPDFKLGVAPLPVSEDPNHAMINASVSTSLAVSTYSKNKEVAKDLVAFFLNPEKSTTFFEAVQFNPISSIHQFETLPWIDEALSYVESGKSYVDPTIPQAVKDESGKMLQAYYSDAATAQDVLDALDEAWKIYNDINQ